MTDAVQDLWRRAREALRVAKHDLAVSPDAAASRAYYAAFYAVSAHFLVEGRTFRKHSALEAAVHRDLVATGQCTDDLGRKYSRLAQLRARGDYGGARHVSPEDAHEALGIAGEILRLVAGRHPDVLGPEAAQP